MYTAVSERILEYLYGIYFEYCRVDQNGTGASDPHGGCARDFVNFRGEKYASRARDAAARARQFTLPGSKSGTLPPLGGRAEIGISADSMNPQKSTVQDPSILGPGR